MSQELSKGLRDESTLLRQWVNALSYTGKFSDNAAEHLSNLANRIDAIADSIADRLERPGVEVSTCLTVEPMKRGEPVTCRIDAVGFYAEDFERIAGEYPTNGRMVNVTICPAG